MTDSVKSGWGDPEEEVKRGSNAWLHVPARGKLKLCILSERPIRYAAHWVGRGMVRCPNEPDVDERRIVSGECPYCDRHMGRQMRYAFSVYDLDVGAAALFEVGAAAAVQMSRHVNVVGVLRGACFLFAKEGGRERGKVIAQGIAGVINSGELPAAADVAAILARAQEEPSVRDRMELGL